MGVLNDISNMTGQYQQLQKNKQRANENTVVVITTLGKSKSERFDLPGAKWSVLNYLNENGPSTIREIAGEMETSPEKVKAICKSLAESGYLMKRTGGGVEE